MTLLRHEDLWKAMHRDLAEALVVTPLLDDDQVGPASIDLRLGTEFLLLRRRLGPGLNPAAPDAREIVERLHEPVSVALGEPLWLHPSEFILGATLEFIRLPADLGAYLLGRSSWGRLGLLVATAVMVQPGWSGSLTFELVNEGSSPVCLYPGLRVAQLAVHSLAEPTRKGYDREDVKYLAPTGPQASRLAWGSEEMEQVKKLGNELAHRATS
jgi:dCTP deaminase